MSILERIFRSRCAPRPRAFRPSVLNLETRQLMADAGVPMGRIIQVAGPPPVTGGLFELQVVKDPNAPAIMRTTWTVSGAYAASSNPIPSKQGGYQYQTFGTETVTGDKIDGYWNGDGGAHSISVMVEYTPISVLGVPYPSRYPDVYSGQFSIMKPSSYMFTVSTGSTNVKPTPEGGYLGTATTGGPGIVWKAGVDTTAIGVSGTFGVVQTFTTDITSSDSWGNYRAVLRTNKGPLAGPSQLFTTSPTLLDTISSFPVYPYYGIIKPTGRVTPGSPIDSFIQTDSPGSPIDNTSGDTYRRSDKFTDTLMFQPDGGLAIPLGSMTWGWTGAVDNSIKGQPRLMTALSSNPKASQYSTMSSDRTLPQWQDLSTNGWLNDNWVMVHANPFAPPNTTPPLLTAIATWSLGDDPNDPLLQNPPPPPAQPAQTGHTYFYSDGAYVDATADYDPSQDMNP